MSVFLKWLIFRVICTFNNITDQRGASRWIKHTFELRKLFVMIISTNFLCWESNSETSVRVSKGFQTRENIWNQRTANRVVLLFSKVWKPDKIRSTRFWYSMSGVHVPCKPWISLTFFQVESIYIFLERDTDHYAIEAQNLPEEWKLNFHFLGRRMRYKDAFQYASNNLLLRNVMIMNADCYVDKGFEQLDESILNRKTMYALTRHETPENVRLCNATDFCGPRALYIGSHDAFLFRLLEPLPSQLLDSIDYRPNMLGIEQVLIFNFHKYAQFNTKNPCKILYIVHHHCSKLRKMNERTVQGKPINHYLNMTGHFETSPFSGL